MMIQNALDSDVWAAGLKDVSFIMLLADSGLQDERAIINSRYEVCTKRLLSHVQVVHFYSDSKAYFNNTMLQSIQYGRLGSA